LINPDATNWPELVTGATRAYLTTATIAIVALFCLYDFKEIPILFKGLTLIGEGSYSVYLLHPIVYERLVGRLNGASPLVVYFTLAATTILLAIAAYYYFEKPFMKWFKTKRPPQSLPAIARN
jgi:peptidoglycan/LPS O-acetylase OafA/YrhL